MNEQQAQRIEPGTKVMIVGPTIDGGQPISGEAKVQGVLWPHVRISKWLWPLSSLEIIEEAGKRCDSCDKSLSEYKGIKYCSACTTALTVMTEKELRDTWDSVGDELKPEPLRPGESVLIPGKFIRLGNVVCGVRYALCQSVADGTLLGIPLSALRRAE